MFRTDIKKNYRIEIKVINEAKIKCYRSSQEERFPASIWEEKSSQMFLMVVAYYLVASFTKRRKGIPIGAEYPGGEVQSTLSNRRARLAFLMQNKRWPESQLREGPLGSSPAPASQICDLLQVN